MQHVFPDTTKVSPLTYLCQSWNIWTGFQDIMTSRACSPGPRAHFGIEKSKFGAFTGIHRSLSAFGSSYSIIGPILYHFPRLQIWKQIFDSFFAEGV